MHVTRVKRVSETVRVSEIVAWGKCVEWMTSDTPASLWAETGRGQRMTV